MEARGKALVTTIQKTHPSHYNFPFIQPVSFTPRLAGYKGLDVALGLGRLLSNKMQPSLDQSGQLFLIEADLKREDPLKKRPEAFAAMTKHAGYPDPVHHSSKQVSSCC